MDRRRFLGLFGLASTVAVAGCSGGASDDGTPTPAVTLDRTYELDAGLFKGRGFTLSESGRVVYDGTVNGPPIDFYVMPRSEFQTFRNSEPFEHVAPASAPDTTSASVDTDVAAGDYYFLVDNSARGSASPPSEDATATVEVSFASY